MKRKDWIKTIKHLMGIHGFTRDINGLRGYVAKYFPVYDLSKCKDLNDAFKYFIQ